MGQEDKITITEEEYWTYIEPVHFVIPNNWDESGGKLMVFGKGEFILP